MVCMTQNRRTYDPEKADISVVRYKKGGRFFEVAVDPDLVFPYRKGAVSLYQVLRSHRIFHKATEGREVFESSLEEAFGTADEETVADIIMRKGDVQLSPNHREKLRNQKKEKILDILVKRNIDPRTNTPHPRNRLEKIIETKNISINEVQPAEQQVHSVASTLKKHVPIEIAQKTIRIKTDRHHGYKIRDHLESYGTIENESWEDGFSCSLTVPAGLHSELVEKINTITKGNIRIESA